MSSTQTTILTAAILVVAALAGVAVFDDSDAESSVASYIVGTTTYTEAIEGDTVELSSIEDLGATIPAGMKFVGWVQGTDVKDDSPVLAVGSTVKVDGTDTFTAKLESIEYTVTFQVDGKAVTDGVLTGTIGETYSAPADPKKTGYIFMGWAIGDAEPVKVIKDAKFSADVTYDAVFAVDYVIKFDINGSIIDGGTVSDMDIPADPVREGYVFVAWSIDGKAVDPKTYVPTGDTAFVALFEPADCIVTFTVDGQTVLTQTVKYDSTATEPALIPDKDGYDFVGWFVDGAEYDFGAKVTGDVTLVAEFTETSPAEPEGLDNPMTVTYAIIGAVIVLAVLGLAIWKKDEIKAYLAGKLAKEGKE